MWVAESTKDGIELTPSCEGECSSSFLPASRLLRSAEPARAEAETEEPEVEAGT